MQQPFMFLNLGDGWKLVNNHTGTSAALSDLSLQWGTDDPADQPDPAVLSFRLRDRSGTIAGKALTLAGARVILQLSDEPTWRQMNRVGAWDALPGTIADLHQLYEPNDPAQPDDKAITLFDGIVSTGGSVSPHRKGGWTLALSATSRMVLWKRLQSQGPTTTGAAYTGLHWTGTPASRFAELNRRAREAGAPTADDTGLDYPKAVAPYSDDYPSQLDLLHRLFAHSSLMPLWYETPARSASRLTPMPMGQPAVITARQDGTLGVRQGTRETQMIDNSLALIDDDSLDIPAPVTRIVVKGKRAARNNDGKYEFGDAEAQYSAPLPANLTATQSSLTVDSDAILSDETGGTYPAIAPTAEDRTRRAEWILATDTRLRLAGLVADSRKLDPVRRPELYRSCPSGPIIIATGPYAPLTGSDGRPAVSGAYTTIGGRLTFSWRGRRPVLRHELTLWPLPLDTTRRTTWNGLRGWTLPWKRAKLTLAELGLIEAIETTANTLEE